MFSPVRIGYRQYEGCYNWRMPLTYSSSWPASVSRWHAHSRSLVFHTLYRGERYTRLCPLISYRPIRCTLTFSPTWESYFTFLRHSSPPSPSAVATAASRPPTGSFSTCSHHRIPNCAPGALYDPSHRSNSDCVAMYCATVFCRHLINSFTVKNPASSLADAAEVYLHLLSCVLRGSRPVRHLATWVWTPPPGPCLCGGVTTQVSALKSSTAWTTALQKKVCCIIGSYIDLHGKMINKVCCKTFHLCKREVVSSKTTDFCEREITLSWNYFQTQKFIYSYVYILFVGAYWSYIICCVYMYVNILRRWIVHSTFGIL